METLHCDIVYISEWKLRRGRNIIIIIEWRLRSVVVNIVKIVEWRLLCAVPDI